MLTLTVRHKAGMPLATLRRGLCRAWRRLQQTRTWREFREACGLDGYVRAIEVTWGRNGWHPHVHVLMMAMCPDKLHAWRDRLSACWRTTVLCEMSAACVPSDAIGLAITTCDADYITKMALEVTSVSKIGRKGHLNQWQIAERIAEGKLPGELWLEYSKGMRGCHQLQWSRGLRDRVGLREKEPEAETPTICEVPKETWREMADEPGGLTIFWDHCRNTSLRGDEAREWILTWFANTSGNGHPRWDWIDGTAHLRWDTS